MYLCDAKNYNINISVMANDQHQRLMQEFLPVSTAKWEEAIEKDLKGADYTKRLVWQTAEGFSVRPYYRAEDLTGIKYLGSKIGEFPYVRGTRDCNNWRIHQTISVSSPAEANATALKMVEGGVESLGFCIPSDGFTGDDAASLLRGIDLTTVDFVFCGTGLKDAFGAVIEYVTAGGYNPEEVRIAFTFDPIVNDLSLKGAFVCGETGSQCFAQMAEVIKMTANLKHIRAIGVNGHRFHNSGSTLVQELAFTLAVGHEYLVKMMEAGLTIDQAAHSVRFTMGVSANYFMEIAKIRAARMLWANIVKQYDPQSSCSEKMMLHAVTSRWNMTMYDPYVNMLRGTTEAMSAAIAGVRSLEVLPFDGAFRKPTDFSYRIARGTQLLLKHESRFDQVTDPSGGSYYIENLTQSIAEQAWALFREVEDKGGYIAAFKAGFVQDVIEASAAKKNMNIATRRQTLLGTNQYPNFTEVVAEKAASCGCGTEKSSCVCSDDASTGAVSRVLKPYRGAEAFEELRQRIDLSGREPKAFMLTCGSLAFARARSQFSCNFFACAGIRVMDNVHFSSLEVGVKEALDAKADIVVVCSSDDEYATIVPEVQKLLGNKAILVVAGAPACQGELEAAGINHFISVKSNVLETLKGYLNELGL